MCLLEKKIDLFLFIGQSNMAGRGVTCPRFPEKVPKCSEHAGCEFRSVSDPAKLYPITEAFGSYENRPEGIYEPGCKSGSLVPAFVNAYYKDTKTPIIAVSASKGGSSITEWLPGTPFLEDAILRFQDSVSYLKTHGYRIRHRYMLWCQGETDGEHNMNPKQYKKAFVRMIDTLAGIGIEHCFLIRIGHFNASTAAPETSLLDFRPIMKAQDELAAEQPFVTMVSVKFGEMLERGLMQDAYHYYQQAYNEVGTDAGIHTAAFVNQQK